MSHKNLVLLELLQELGWSQSELVRRLNTALGSEYVRRSTASEWVNQGRIPRDPVPTVVAHVLSEELGRTVTVDEVWQGRVTPSRLWQPALEGVAGAWLHSGTLQAVECWQRDGEAALDFSRRSFLPIAGSDLIGPVWSYLESTKTPLSPIQYLNSCRDGRIITSSMNEIAFLVVDRVRRLDDTEGGSLKNLRFVHRHLLNIGAQVISGDAQDSTALTELFQLWMSLCQIAGWMAYDAQQHGLAQRYFYSGLHAAHSVGDRDYGAYLLAMLAHQAITRGKLHEARDLATAAARASKNGPAALRSLVGGLVAHTEALGANTYGFEANMAAAQQLVEDPYTLENRPSWLYWFGAAQSRVRQAHGLLTLAETTTTWEPNRLTQAARLLAPNAAVDDTQFPREAVYNRVWLARSQVWRGEIDAAIQTALPILGDQVVRSPRSLAQLRILNSEFGKRAAVASTPRVHEFRRQLAELLY
ncbi:MAG: hypothetical protein ACRDPW_09740 [Mycobacteriales bacterium]